MREHKLGELLFYSYDHLGAYSRVTQIVTSRLGGKSVRSYKSLNLSLGVGDDPGTVLENRAALSRFLGLEPTSLTVAQQPHGTKVTVVKESDRGKGAVRDEDTVNGADAMITNVPELPLMMLSADCLIISFFDPEENVVALAHAGWKSTAGRIADKTVGLMKREFECDPVNILVGLSPSIGPCCYEVGAEVVEAMSTAYPDRAEEFLNQPSKGKTHLDLWHANTWQLEAAGIYEDHIEIARVCTACRTDLFYSARAAGADTGRFGSLIMLHGYSEKAY